MRGKSGSKSEDLGKQSEGSAGVRGLRCLEFSILFFYTLNSLVGCRILGYKSAAFRLVNAVSLYIYAASDVTPQFSDVIFNITHSWLSALVLVLFRFSLWKLFNNFFIP